MTRKFLYMILAIAVGFASCEKQEAGDMDDEDGEGVLPKPTASFSYDIPDPTDPFTIQFTNDSENLSESRWAFGDDSTSADMSPIHTFLKTGTFNVKLVTLNEEGFWAQREEIITISPSGLVQLIAAPSDGELHVSYETTMTVAQSEWYLKQPSGSYHPVSQADAVSLEITAGEFAEVYVELTTPKGSKARLDMLLADLGIVRDMTTLGNEFSASHENSSGRDAGEGSSKLTDNNTGTKWYVNGVNADYFYWQFEYFQPQLVNGYSMTSGNDQQPRDPKDWDFLGSHDGENWVVLDTRADESFPDRGMTRIFLFDNSTTYTFYKMHIKARVSSGSFALAEFRMLQLPE